MIVYSSFGVAALKAFHPVIGAHEPDRITTERVALDTYVVCLDGEQTGTVRRCVDEDGNPLEFWCATLRSSQTASGRAKLNLDALTSQYTATPDRSPPAKPEGLDDRGDGQATRASLVAVQQWAVRRWPNPATLRDGGETLRACQEVATGIDAYNMAQGTDPDVAQATRAAAWLLR